MNKQQKIKTDLQLCEQLLEDATRDKWIKEVEYRITVSFVLSSSKPNNQLLAQQEQSRMNLEWSKARVVQLTGIVNELTNGNVPV